MAGIKIKKLSKRKAQIYEEAQRLFREKGYKATTMRDLARAVGVEAASLYSHIKSKEDILQYICFKMADEFFAAQEDIKDLKMRPDEKLKLAIKAHVGVITDNASAAAVFLHEWRHLSEPYLNDFKLMRRRYENIFAEIIEDGMDQWVFRHLDTKFYVTVLFSSLNWVYDWYQPDGKFDPEEIADRLSFILLNGLNQ